MKMFLALALTLASVSANAATAQKSTQSLGQHKVAMANGFYELSEVCIAATNYDSIKSAEFCRDDADTINMLSTRDVMFSATCTRDYSGRCSNYNAYILSTRMSSF